LSLNASAIYLGIGVSGVIGGVVIGVAGTSGLAPVAAVLTSLALVVLLKSGRSRQRNVEEPVLQPVA
jgi:predicted MFS family arabinose efflux permease